MEDDKSRKISFSFCTVCTQQLMTSLTWKKSFPALCNKKITPRKLPLLSSGHVSYISKVVLYSFSFFCGVISTTIYWRFPRHRLQAETHSSRFDYLTGHTHLSGYIFLSDILDNYKKVIHYLLKWTFFWNLHNLLTKHFEWRIT